MGTQTGGVRPSRRQLLQGTAGLVLAGAVRPATSDAAPVPTDLRPDVVHRGRAIAVTADGRRLVVARANRPSLVITDRRRGGSRTVTLAGHPLELAIRPDRRAVAVTTAFWEHPGLELVRLADGARLVHLDDVGAAPFAPAFTHDGGHLVLTGGEQDGSVRILKGPDLAHGRALSVGRVPRGVAITPDDRFAWVALQAEDALVRVDLRRAAVTRRLAVPALPDRVALSPDGRTLLVAHGGRGAHTISEVDLHRGRVRERPVGGAASGVAWGSAGRRLAAVRDAGAVVSIDRAGHRRRTATVGAPRGLAVAGRHAFTVSAVTGEVGRVRA